MKLCLPLLVAALLIGTMEASSLAAAVNANDVMLDATKVSPFATQMLRFQSTEKTGELPSPWVPGAWAEGAIGRVERVDDGGDGKPAIRMQNLSGQPSLMFKPWTDVSLQKGAWEARIEYRKAGSGKGSFVVELPEKKQKAVDLVPTGAEFKSVVVVFPVNGTQALHRLTFQLYSGLGEGEALFIRGFSLVRTGDLAKTADEEREAADRVAAAEAVSKRELERRALERKPIGSWVRPDAKPVRMDKPLEPPPVTGDTHYVATTGDDTAGDGKKETPWRTIQCGMNKLRPGDRLYIRGGEYHESMLTFGCSGRPDAYITVAGYPEEQVKVINSGGMAVFNLDAGSQWTPQRLHEEAYLVIRDLYVDAVKGNQAFRINGPMQLDGYRNNLAKSRELRHNIWIVNNEIVGGGPAEGGLGGGYGAHDLVFSNNRIHDTTAGLMSYLYCDGTIMEWNTVTNTSRDQDDAGAIKSMSPGVIIRYNKVIDNRRDPESKKAEWAPRSAGGGQWRFLQGISGIYLDYACVDGSNNAYPDALKPVDPANYVYGNTVTANNAGIHVFQSNYAQVFDNIVYDNGRQGAGGWAEGKKDGKWLEFVGPAGYGIKVAISRDVKVFSNLVYDHRKGGISSYSCPGTQIYGNSIFGNALTQIHVEKSDDVAFGYNMIMETAKQGPPFRRLKEDFATVDAFHQKYPYLDMGTMVLRPDEKQTALEKAQQALKTQQVSPQAWKDALQILRANSDAAGVSKAAVSVPQAPFDPTFSLQVPLPLTLPATLEFENYDIGGEGVSFHDTDTVNEGGHYRKDGVDIKPVVNASNGATVGFTKDGEWLEYTVSVSKPGSYPLTITYATVEKSRRIQLTFNNQPLGQPIVFEPSPSWDEMRTIEAGSVTLPAGDGVLRVTIESGPVDLDCMHVGSAK